MTTGLNYNLHVTTDGQTLYSVNASNLESLISRALEEDLQAVRYEDVAGKAAHEGEQTLFEAVGEVDPTDG